MSLGISDAANRLKDRANAAFSELCAQACSAQLGQWDLRNAEWGPLAVREGRSVELTHAA